MKRMIAVFTSMVLFAAFSLGAPPLSATVFPNENNPASVACDGDIGVNVGSSYAIAHSTADLVDCSGSGMVTVENSVGTSMMNVVSYSVIRGVVNFDTSFLGANAVITSAVFSIKPTNVHFDFGSGDYVRLVKNTIASDTAYAVSDFNSLGTAAMANDVYVETLYTNQYANFTLNAAGRTAINKTGVTHFGLRSGLDVTNTQPVKGTDENFPDRGGTVIFFYGSETAGTGSDPKLLIKYTN